MLDFWRKRFSEAVFCIKIELLAIKSNELMKTVENRFQFNLKMIDII